MDIKEMKERAENRIKEMTSISDQEIFKSLLGNYFKELMVEQMKFNENLMERVLKGVENKNWGYDIYCTILKKEELTLYDDILIPILAEDLSENILPLKLLSDYIKRKEKFVIGQIYIDLKFHEIKKVCEKEFIGEIHNVNGESYRVKIKLEQNRKYKEEEKELYEGFILSGTKWKTIINPYSKRFFYVKVEGYLDEIPEDAEIERLTYNLEEYEGLKKEGYICVWNVCKTEIRSQGFPIKLSHNIGYQLDVPLEGINTNGYILTGDNKSIINISRDENKLMVRATREDIKKWDSYEIRDCSRIKKEKLVENLYGNNKLRDVVEYYMKDSLGVIRTKGEINRFINSFEESKAIKLKNVRIEEYIEGENDMEVENDYILDEIRGDEKSNILKFEFEKVNESQHTEDIIAFLMSEVRLYFPEYICVSE
ncbi:hypothetical protein [Haliovirga abyssi]|uniref:Normocyte-binding protein n=1 Tax=Haliovirga abyssi TaxID=2996794 RepID=A0AAU9DIN8_9FUSO|nr:hypothetical protein [Haliovirga abyssi]BDU50624.1 hypothetical protein HLVA_11930 [Haliovirga abyssi]